MNRLHELHGDGATRPAVAQAMAELARFTVEHFRSEEVYMASVAFPGRDNHARIHQDLLKRFGELKSAFLAGTTGADESFFSFLKHWLAAHIAGIDQKYAAHARSQSPAATKLAPTK